MAAEIENMSEVKLVAAQAAKTKITESNYIILPPRT
jgi:hypothetical protein